MGYKIFTHEIHSSYAARLDNYRSYDIVSKDIIQRWTYPYVPDVKFSGSRGAKLERQGMYRASGRNYNEISLPYCFGENLTGTIDLDLYFASPSYC